MRLRIFVFFIAFSFVFYCMAQKIPKDWLKGALEGDTTCIHHVAQFYALHNNHSKEALQWLNKSIGLKGGNFDERPLSMTYLAGYYWAGLGVKKDQEKSMALLKEAAEEGYPYAAFALGYIYKYCFQDEYQSIQWLYKAHIIWYNGDLPPLNLMVLFSFPGFEKLDKNDNHNEFAKETTGPRVLLEEIAASSHNRLAYRYLGDIFLRYMPVHNFKQGILYYEQAALLGDEESKPFVGITTGQDGNTGYAEIGRVFYEGIGTAPQPERAVEYFELGIQRASLESIDNAKCFFYLGLSYYEGKGNKQDFRTAFLHFGAATVWDHEKWPTIEDAIKDPEYKKSYHNTEAMRYLSRCYRFGRGCDKDLKRAEDLLTLAALTDEEMKKLLEETKSNNP